MRFVQCSRDFWLSKNFSLSSFYPKWYASLYVNYNPHSVEHLFVHVERKRDRRNERKAIPFSISLRIVSSKFILKFMPCQLGETLWGEPNTLLEILLTVGRSTRTRHTTFVLVDKDENGKQTDLKSAIKLWSLILTICRNEACGAIKLLSIIYSARFNSTHTHILDHSITIRRKSFVCTLRNWKWNRIWKIRKWLAKSSHPQGIGFRMISYFPG